jgi:BirA family biotin operon repressor/biotin-[acetyl-CoA-carboxylase] ligase
MNYVIHRYNIVGSTNDIAIQMARQGAPEGTVVVAQGQTAGRGRHGRIWASPAGEGLYLSLILEPPVSLDRLWQLSFLVAVAVAEAVEIVSKVQPQLKWPNDILLNGKKVAGILIESPSIRESSGSKETARESGFSDRRLVVVGIGVNVNTKKFPPDIESTATSIALTTGHPIEVAEFERVILNSIASWYSTYIRLGFDPVVDEWKKLDGTIGRVVKVENGQQGVEGTVVEVDINLGKVVIQCDDSRIVLTPEVLGTSLLGFSS